MFKKLVGLVIFLLIANAGIRLALVFFHDQQFQDAVREAALFGASKPDEALRKSASENQIPLDPDYIEIVRKSVVGVNDKVVIKTAYAVLVQLAPGYTKRFDFDYTTP